MKTKKDFDCVEFKNKIQKKISDEYRNVNDIEKHFMISKKVRKNRRLSKFLSKSPVEKEP